MLKTANKIFFALGLILSAGLITGCGDESSSIKNSQELLNVSYDPTREFYVNYNEKFNEYWSRDLGNDRLSIIQSHDGSANQSRIVINGAEADVVTLALAYDIDEIQRAGLIDEGWQNEFPENSTPYTSTIVFLVRKGNLKNIRDWDDLTRDDVSVVTTNPASSGCARWSYLAAWEYARRKFNGDENQILNFMKNLFDNILVLDSSARGATTSFVQRGQGDVLVSFENEALLSIKESPDDFEIVAPSLSILVEPSVAIVDKVADKKGTRAIAQEYLRNRREKFLSSMQS